MLRSQFLLETHSIILCIGIVIYYFASNRIRNKESQLLIWICVIHACDLFWDMMAYSQQGVATVYGFRMHMIANFMLDSLEYLEVGLFVYFIYLIIVKYTGKTYRFLYRLAITTNSLMMFFLVGNCFTEWMFYFDDANYYHRGPVMAVGFVLQMLLVVLCFCMVFKHRKSIPVYLYSLIVLYTFCPIIGAFLQMVFFGFSFMNIAISIPIAGFFIWNVYEDRRAARQQTRILEEARISLMSAQMNPHFIFNALTVIRYLIEEDTQVARDALVHFTNYLHRCIDEEQNRDMVSIQEEVEMAREYAYIEQMRFGNQIDVLFDVEESAVKVPYLTIEPLVENAIKHGLRKRTGKGTVSVTCKKEGHKYLILVEDDGVGFDPSKKKEKSPNSGIGLNNVKERIRLLCNGTMEITSEIGKGTLIRIMIPEVVHENISS